MDLFCHVYFLLENDILQGLTYEAFDRMPTPLHMPKTDVQKKHTLFDSKSFKGCSRSHV